jgi:hypothetical protein
MRYDIYRLTRKLSGVFVRFFVHPSLDYNAVRIVPSILEAHDIIEMEEIERDLGFK